MYMFNFDLSSNDFDNKKVKAAYIVSANKYKLEIFYFHNRIYAPVN